MTGRKNLNISCISEDLIMDTVQIYIDEKLDVEQLKRIKLILMDISYVTDVEISSQAPHGFVVEYEEHHDMPVLLIETLRNQGLHPDIISG